MKPMQLTAWTPLFVLLLIAIPCFAALAETPPSKAEIDVDPLKPAADRIPVTLFGTFLETTRSFIGSGSFTVFALSA